MRNLIRWAKALRHGLQEAALLRPEIARVAAVAEETKTLGIQLNQKLDEAKASIALLCQKLDEAGASSLQLGRKLDETKALGAELQPSFMEAVAEAVALMRFYCQLADRRWIPAPGSTSAVTPPHNRAALGTGRGLQGIAIISVPKSASTFLFHLLQRVTASFQSRRVLQTVAGRLILPEADLLCAAAIRAEDKPVIVREHLLPNANTLLFLEQSRLWPVILSRDIGDALVSLAEEWERQWTEGREEIERDGYHPQFSGAVPQTFIDNFMRADWITRYQMTIDLALPWYCEFIAGWESVRLRNPHFGTFLTYDEVASTCSDSVAAILRKLDEQPLIDIGEAEAELKADRRHANFNIGRSGRGRELLTSSQRAQIASTWASFTPSVATSADSALPKSLMRGRGEIVLGTGKDRHRRARRPASK